MNRIAIACLVAIATTAARAQEPPHVYALVSAIGSKLQYVKPRMTTGTHLESMQRAELQVPDTTLDMAALRGLEHVVKGNDPRAKVEYLRINPDELKDIDPPKRGEAAVGKLAKALEKMPGRDKWYQIILVAPRYVANEHNGMGSKLNGIGVFIQPLERSKIDMTDSTGGLFDSYETVTPEGEKVDTTSTAFVAPFFYAQVWVIDPQTLQVIQTTDRFEVQRIFDPKTAGTRVELSVPPEKLGPIVETFVEKSAEKAAAAAIGVVTVGDPRVVKPN